MSWHDDRRSFQLRFSPYFPYLEKDDEQAGIEMEWLFTRAYDVPVQAIRKAKVLKQLAQFQASITALANCEITKLEDIGFQHVFDKETDPSIISSERALVEILFDLQIMEEDGLLQEAVSKLCERARKAIDTVPEAEILSGKPCRL